MTCFNRRVSLQKGQSNEVGRKKKVGFVVVVGVILLIFNYAQWRIMYRLRAFLDFNAVIRI